MKLRRFAGYLKNKTFYNLAYLLYCIASRRRVYLDETKFNSLLKKYEKFKPWSHYDYSDKEQTDVANKRLELLIKENNGVMPKSVCEIGPGSGRLLQAFANAGCDKVIGVDIQNPAIPDERIKYSTKGVHEMNDIEDNSIDMIYSFDAFEHIPDPINGFKNCLKKLKPGGRLYVQIGPTYYSPWGYHYYIALNMPYVNVLFSEETLKKYVENKGIKIAWTNRVAASNYIKYFQNLHTDYNLEFLKYDFAWYNSSMIIKYPDIFKSKQDATFDDFFIGAIEVKIQKSNTSDYLR